MYTTIENKVKAYIENNNLLNNISKLYIATSGGADSMAMLAFMRDHASQFQVEVYAAHVNHGIRGETARRDANFVKSYCEKHSIEYTLFDAEADHIQVPKNASEDWARQLRYGYLDTLVRNSQNPDQVAIATAHTLSDQTETLLFRLARGGSGLNGLTGIPAKRGNYIRPFLCLTRAEIEYLVDYYKTSNITDETNLTDDYSRNKIRHYVVPQLKLISDKAEQNIGKAVDRISKANQFIKKYTSDIVESSRNQNKYLWRLDEIQYEDDIIIEEFIMQLFDCYNTDTSSGQYKRETLTVTETYIENIKNYIKSARNSQSNQEEHIGTVNITDYTKIVVTADCIAITDDSIESLEKNIGIGVNTFGCFNAGLLVTKLSYSQFKAECLDKRQLCNYADVDKLDLSTCTLRGKRDGDKFKPACKVGGKVGKFIKRVSYAERNNIPLVTNNQNEVIWLYNIGFTDGYTPVENQTKWVYRFEPI